MNVGYSIYLHIYYIKYTFLLLPQHSTFIFTQIFSFNVLFLSDIVEPDPVPVEDVIEAAVAEDTSATPPGMWV